MQIAITEPPGGGRIGLTFCPGKKDPHAMTGAWDRDVVAGFDAIRKWGASMLITLMEQHELDLLRVPTLGEATRAAGLTWMHTPIKDVSVPTQEFERHWPEVAAQIERELRTGRNVVIHCRGGLGRAGLVAVLLLRSFGVSALESRH